MDATIGHNNPPSALDSARAAIADLRSFSNDHTVVTDHEQAMTPTKRQSVRQIARVIVEAAGGETGGAA